LGFNLFNDKIHYLLDSLIEGNMVDRAPFGEFLLFLIFSTRKFFD